MNSHLALTIIKVRFYRFSDMHDFYLYDRFGRLAVAQRFAVQTAAIECKAASSLDQIWL